MHGAKDNNPSFLISNRFSRTFAMSISLLNRQWNTDCCSKHKVDSLGFKTRKVQCMSCPLCDRGSTFVGIQWHAVALSCMLSCYLRNSCNSTATLRLPDWYISGWANTVCCSTARSLLYQCFSTAGPWPVPGPGINYTGLREVLLESVILDF